MPAKKPSQTSENVQFLVRPWDIDHRLHIRTVHEQVEERYLDCSRVTVKLTLPITNKTSDVVARIERLAQRTYFEAFYG